MWPDRVLNPGPPTYESGALPIALRGPAKENNDNNSNNKYKTMFPFLYEIIINMIIITMY